MIESGSISKWTGVVQGAPFMDDKPFLKLSRQSLELV